MNNYCLKQYCPVGRNYEKSKQVKKIPKINYLGNFEWQQSGNPILFLKA